MALSLEDRRRARVLAKHVEENPTIAQFAETWLERFPRPSGKTQQTYACMIRAFVAEFGHRSFDSVTRMEARNYSLQHIGDARYCRSLFADAVDDGVATKNPFAGLRLLPGQGGGTRKRIVVPTEEQVRALIEAAPAPLDTMIPFAAYTGLRCGEHLALEVTDLQGDRVSVTKALDHKGLPTTPKTEASIRKALVPPQAVERLELPESGRIWPITRDRLIYAWCRLREQVGIPETRWHDLRHFCATWLLELGASTWDVAIQLGHENDTQVRTRYGHPNKAKALDRLSRLSL